MDDEWHWRHLLGALLGLGFGVVLVGLVHYGAADIRRPGLYERFFHRESDKKRIVNS